MGESVATPLWRKCEVATHTPENGTWESSKTLENSERDCRGQNTSYWSVFYTVGKVLKCRLSKMASHEPFGHLQHKLWSKERPRVKLAVWLPTTKSRESIWSWCVQVKCDTPLERSWSVDCPKWPRMNYLDICSTSYGRKKGRESNWQFDSRPQKVGNQSDPGACKWSATHRWKALKESYNSGLDLAPIRVRGEKLWTPKVLGVQIETVSGLHFKSPGKKSHLDASVAKSYREYYMGEGGGFPRIRAVVSQMSPSSPVACPNTESVQNQF